MNILISLFSIENIRPSLQASLVHNCGVSKDILFFTFTSYWDRSSCALNEAWQTLAFSSHLGKLTCCIFSQSLCLKPVLVCNDLKFFLRVYFENRGDVLEMIGVGRIKSFVLGVFRQSCNCVVKVTKNFACYRYGIYQSFYPNIATSLASIIDSWLISWYKENLPRLLDSRC